MSTVTEKQKIILKKDVSLYNGKYVFKTNYIIWMAC